MFRNEILSYVPAQISKGKITRVYFYCYHPQLAEMKRVVIKCNRIKKSSVRDQYAKALVHEINIKLAKGWNPFIEQEAGRSYTSLISACESFLSEKKRELRPDGFRAYTSFISIFINWVEQNKTRAYYVVSFTQTDAIEFMDYVYNQKEVSATTYNNYRRFYLLLWNYFIGKQYVKANVFDVIQKKKQQPKTRTIIPKDVRLEITEYLQKKNYRYLVFLKLMYHALMRPKEILQTKAGNYDIEKQIIRIEGGVAKNGKERCCTIPDSMIDDLRKVLQGVDKSCYLFAEDMQPGQKVLDVRYAGKYWNKLRMDLKLPKEMQMYSFRDSGITDALSSGIPANMVRDHADHSSLEITNLYSKHFNPAVHETFKEKAPEF